MLNLEVNYANFCGVRSIVIAGPSRDASPNGGNQALAQYSRAVQEALTIGSSLTFLIHMPMYREPEDEQAVETLASLELQSNKGKGHERAATANGSEEIDLFAAWASWHHVRSTCNYNLRLHVGKFLRLFDHEHLFNFITIMSEKSLHRLPCNKDTEKKTDLIPFSDSILQPFRFPKSCPKRTCKTDGSRSLCIT